MATYLEQARRFAAGDWLGRDPYHPYHLWQKRAAPPEQWLRWYGEKSFHQAPLYSYAIAVAMRITSDPVPLIRVVQVLLGAATCVLLVLLGRAACGPGAGLVAGLIGAVYGPLFYLELQVLREGPAVFGFLLIAWLTIHSARHAALPPGPDLIQARARGVVASAAAVGGLIGGYALFYETAPILLLGAVVAVGAAARKISWRRAAGATAAVVVGALLGFAPMLARNAAVGAPLFGASSRPGINLAFCNMADAYDSGVTFSPPGEPFRRIMDASGGSTLGVVREVWRSYEGRRARLLRNWWNRFTAVWIRNELPDNTSYDFFRRHSVLLRASPTFGWVFPAGAAMMAALAVNSIARSRSTRRPPPRPGRRAAESRAGSPGSGLHPGAAGRNEYERAEESIAAAARRVLLVYTGLLAAALTVVPPQARYRLFLVPCFALYAAMLIAAVPGWLRARRWGRMGGVAAACAAFALAQHFVSRQRLRADVRPADWVVAGADWMRTGDDAQAVAYFRRALELAPKNASVRRAMAECLARLGRIEEAVSNYERVLKDQPNMPGAQRALEALRRRPRGPATRAVGEG